MKNKTETEAAVKAKSDEEYAPGPGMIVGKVVRRWGVDGDLVLQRLQGKVIHVTLPSGDVVTGVLVGYNEYTLTLTVGGEGVLLNKGFFVSVKLAT